MTSKTTKNLSTLAQLSPPLTFQWGEKTYTLPPLMADDGLRLKILMTNPMMGFTDDGELTEIMRIFGATWEPVMVEVDVLDPITGVPRLDENEKVITTTIDQGRYVGGVYQELKDDGVAWPDIMQIGKYCLIRSGLGEVAADAWMAGELETSAGNSSAPEEPGGNRATKRAAKKAAKKAPTAKAGTTNGRASRARTAKTTPAAASTTRTPK